ncbi:hypothetical protein J2T02_002594 [Chitinophaga terrae (ex Kim and Jung 2007)]|nr:hypothetical protein [Chitinophaga terrae (ex Kim and Jung 2007)]
MERTTLSQLMYLSWEIQRSRKCSRSRALLSAWIIKANEEIMIYHLVKKRVQSKDLHRVKPQGLTLFQ